MTTSTAHGCARGGVGAAQAGPGAFRRGGPERSLKRLNPCALPAREPSSTIHWRQVAIRRSAVSRSSIATRGVNLALRTAKRGALGGAHAEAAGPAQAEEHEAGDEEGTLSPPNQQALFEALWAQGGVQPIGFIPALFKAGSDGTFRGLFLPAAGPTPSPSAPSVEGPLGSLTDPYERVRKGDVLLSVPLSAALMVPVGASQSGRTPEGKSAAVVLASLLISVLGDDTSARATGSTSDDGDGQEDARQQLWKQYRRLLPGTFESAADWPSSAVALLGAPSAIEEVERTRDNQKVMAAAVAHETGASPDAAMWAVRAVLSRSFTFPLPCAFLDSVPPPAAAPPRAGAQFTGNRPTRNLEDMAGSLDSKSAASAVPVRGGVAKETLSSEPAPQGADVARMRNGARLQQVHHDTGSESFLQSGDAQGDVRWFQALVPIIDMANHAPEASSAASFSSSMETANASWRVSSSPRSDSSAGSAGEWGRVAHFQLCAKRDLAPGQQILISYGPHSSLTFLLNFGFLPSTNPHDRLLLYASLQDALDDVEKRVRLQARKEEDIRALVGPGCMFWVQADGYAALLMDVLCIHHSNDLDELTELSDVFSTNRSLVGANIRASVKAAAAQQIVSRCNDLLKSLEQQSGDSDYDLGTAAGLAYQQRHHQIDILQRTIARYEVFVAFAAR